MGSLLCTHAQIQGEGRCGVPTSLIKPSSTNEQGLVQSVSSLQSSSILQKERNYSSWMKIKAAAKRVEEVYQDLLSDSVHYSTSLINYFQP